MVAGGIDVDELIEFAKKYLVNSYAPYSGVHVSSAVVTDDGRVFVGVNVENASLGLTLCAERVAIATAVTNGARKIKAVVIVSDTDEPLPPCGACRQFIYEFADGDIPIVSYSVRTGVKRVWRLSSLLPNPFKPSHVKR